MGQYGKQEKQYTPEQCRRKADQHWEMAGLAQQDGDSADAASHTKKAKMWEERLMEAS